MSLTRWDPFREMDHLRQQVNRLFEETLPRPQASGEVATAGWTPAVDIRETTHAIVLEADLPGLRKEDLEVSVSGDTLSISGLRAPGEAEEPAQQHRLERSFGRFHRSFALDVPTNPEAVEASYRNGVLQILVPKAEQAKPKQITIVGD
jgi:HSP20 family protein